MKNNCYSIFEMLPHWYPLVARAASLHILHIERASLFAAKLKGGCAIGEALAVEGEERSLLLQALWGRKRVEETNKGMAHIHMHTPICHQAGST